MGAAHSDYLGAAVCYGLPGFLLFLATLFRFWKGIGRYAASSMEERTLRDAALLSLVGVSITMIAESTAVSVR